jgi:hypothetical protein
LTTKGNANGNGEEESFAALRMAANGCDEGQLRRAVAARNFLGPLGEGRFENADREIGNAQGGSLRSKKCPG